MNSAFASGKNAFGFCDRCGFRAQLSAMKKLTINEKITNIKVCPSCYEPDHPQYKSGRVVAQNREALRDPRPDTAQAESRTIP